MKYFLFYVVRNDEEQVITRGLGDFLTLQEAQTERQEILRDHPKSWTKLIQGEIVEEN